MCDITPQASVRLPLDKEAPREARQFLHEHLCKKHHLDKDADCLLLVSELVTNAIQHGGPPIILTVSCNAESGLRVSVRDGVPNIADIRKNAFTPDAESGRGISIVDLVSDEWGVEQTDDGKSVWFVKR